MAISLPEFRFLFIAISRKLLAYREPEGQTGVRQTVLPGAVEGKGRIPFSRFGEDYEHTRRSIPSVESVPSVEFSEHKKH